MRTYDDFLMESYQIREKMVTEVCVVQRVYPMRPDSKQVRLFGENGRIAVRNIVKWEMEATNPW